MIVKTDSVNYHNRILLSRCCGGDVDLLVENDTLPSTMQRAQVKLALETSLEMSVDIIGIKRGAQPNAFQQIALATGILLGGGR